MPMRSSSVRREGGFVPLPGRRSPRPAVTSTPAPRRRLRRPLEIGDGLCHVASCVWRAKRIGRDMVRRRQTRHERRLEKLRDDRSASLLGPLATWNRPASPRPLQLRQGLAMRAATGPWFARSPRPWRAARVPTTPSAKPGLPQKSDQIGDGKIAPHPRIRARGRSSGVVERLERQRRRTLMEASCVMTMRRAPTQTSRNGIVYRLKPAKELDGSAVQLVEYE